MHILCFSLQESIYNYSQNIWDKLQFSSEIENNGKSPVSTFQTFLASIEKKFFFWQEDWALVYNSSKFWDFPEIKTLKLFGNSWGNSVTPHPQHRVAPHFCFTRPTFHPLKVGVKCVSPLIWFSFWLIRFLFSLYAQNCYNVKFLL